KKNDDVEDVIKNSLELQSSAPSVPSGEVEDDGNVQNNNDVQDDDEVEEGLGDVDEILERGGELRRLMKNLDESWKTIEGKTCIGEGIRIL
ncbi:hypothetical protein Dimus_036754, partial [Dionaea muscipula]